MLKDKLTGEWNYNGSQAMLHIIRKTTTEEAYKVVTPVVNMHWLNSILDTRAYRFSWPFLYRESAPSLFVHADCLLVQQDHCVRVTLLSNLGSASSFVSPYIWYLHLKFTEHTEKWNGAGV